MEPSAGSLSWARVGFAFGLRTYSHMGFGPDVNLASLLGNTYGWRQRDVLFTIGLSAAHKQIPIEMRHLLLATYAVGLVLCSWAAARQTKQNSARVLIALSIPWLLFFAVLPQMTHRYLFWAAAVSVLPLAVSWWYLVPCTFLVSMSTLLMLSNMHGEPAAIAGQVLMKARIAPVLLLSACTLNALYAAFKEPHRRRQISHA